MGAPLLPGFRLDQTFFGFKPEDRTILHENIFNLIWFGEGRWDWNTVYNMPIFLRKFWIEQVNQKHDAINEQNKQSTKPVKNIHRAPIQKK